MSDDQGRVVGPSPEDDTGELDTSSPRETTPEPEIPMSANQDTILDDPEMPGAFSQTESGLKSETPFEVRPVAFPSLAPPTAPERAVAALDFLKDVDLDVTVELGRAEMSLQEVLGLSAGVVIELDKLAGEPVDILVNGKLVGRGEVVVIESMFGVRVTDIILPSDRWKYR